MPLLDICPLTGAVETMQYDASTKTLVIKRTEQVDHILDSNTDSYNDSAERWRGGEDDFWRVASIPLTLLFAWLQEFNATRSPETRVQDPFTTHPEWEKWMYARLNSSEFRKLRTAPVRI